MKSIPIQNIYYLLSYAWNKLDERDLIKVDFDTVTNLPDLFAKLLANGIKILLKRGLAKSYVELTEVVPGIRGKFQLGATVKKALHRRQKTFCSFDEYSADILANQVLYTSVQRLRSISSLSPNLRNELTRIMSAFPAVNRIELKTEHFSLIRRSRQSSLYMLLLNVCELSFHNFLPSEEAGKFLFKVFTKDDKQMNRLFEEFVKRFYAVELPKSYKVHSRKITWELTPTKASKDTTSYLPQMRTDVTIEHAGEQTIIDAKYYRNTMDSYYGKESIKSANLYQLFAYLLNQEDKNNEATKRTRGILLYPMVNREYDLEYYYKQHLIQIKTVNLNDNWQRIDQRLRALILT